MKQVITLSENAASRIKEICMLGGDVSSLISNNVLEAINNKLKDIKNN